MLPFLLSKLFTIGWPLLLWWLVRYLAGSLAIGSVFYGAAITAAPALLFAVMALACTLVGNQRQYIVVFGLGSVLSGGIALYLEAARWQPYLSQVGLFDLVRQLDWPLLLSASVCFLLPALPLTPANRWFHLWRSQKLSRGLHGSAQWMTMAKARERLSNGSLVIGEAYEPSKAPKLGGKAPLLLADGKGGHLLTVAGSGSGKTVSVAMPNVLNWQGPLVVHDPKGELHQDCHRHRMRMGRKVLQLNPAALDSDTLNVLDWLEPDSESVVDNCQAIASWLSDGEGEGKDQYFDAEAQKLVVTLLLYVLLEPELPSQKRHLGTVRELLVNGYLDRTLKYIAAKEAGFAFGVPQQFASELYTILTTAEGQWAGIFGHASKMTAWLTQPRLAKLVCGDAGRGTLPCKSTVGTEVDVFVCVPLKTLDANPAVVRLIIGTLLTLKYEIPVQAEPIQTLFLLDEMPRLKRMELLETARDAGRGFGVLLWTIMQDIGQLERYYQSSGRQSWFENAYIKTFFGINDFDTAKMISDSLGTTTQVQQTVSGGRGLGDSTSFQAIARPLLTPEEVMTMTVDEDGNPDEQIVFVRSQPPLRCGMAKHYRRKEFKQ
ncbi:type IV secretory system conjugative DNA transfer family protein [Ferrimonas pelagia]|uniref:Ti-type conjugative transfer system protein TraG n=1 Tax=Ferrimonas pelagia TaxID=1177826 RepID=A0ABP9EE73_9GAMM